VAQVGSQLGQAGDSPDDRAEIGRRPAPHAGRHAGGDEDPEALPGRVPAPPPAGGPPGRPRPPPPPTPARPRPRPPSAGARDGPRSGSRAMPSASSVPGGTLSQISTSGSSRAERSA